MAENKWILLVKKKFQEVKAENKLEGAAALREAIKRAKVEWQNMKKEKPSA